MSEAEDPIVTPNRAGHESLEVTRSQISQSALSHSFGVSGFLRSFMYIYCMHSGISRSYPPVCM